MAQLSERIDIAKVWAGHPVGFALETFGEHQFVAFYDAKRRMTLGHRKLGAKRFKLARVDETLGWDSHNAVVLGIDPAGHIHLSGNMHNRALVYFRSQAPLDITSMQRLPMTGRNEGRVTYPKFFRGRNGQLHFAFRDGMSGSGIQLYRRYNAKTQKWSSLFSGPLVDGEGKLSAYLYQSGIPVLGPDGAHHIVWVWRDTPDAATNHHICYARSFDLKNWTRSDGTPIARPITFATGEIVDPVKAGQGTINNNVVLGFDAEGRPVVSYHKFDKAGATQLYNARLEKGRWVRRQTSAWTYRWKFGGGGSLDFKIHLSPVEAVGGELRQDFWHAKHGAGTFILDPRTLKAIARRPVDRVVKSLSKAESAGHHVRWARDTGTAPFDYRLRWETLPENRDHARASAPPPIMLSLFGFE